jgi:hypothetical protein
MTTPNQQYVYVQNPPQGSRTGGSQTGGQGQSGSGSAGSAPRQGNTVQLPKAIPGPVRIFLGNRHTLMYMWLIAMILVGFDEWHNYGILPRPSRLWYTSLTYGLLALASAVDAMVPIANALAIGFTIMLVWQYYNGSGQFGKTSGATS